MHRHLRGRWLFCRADGEPLDYNRAYRAWHRVQQAAGLPALNIHGMRHSYASQLVLRGVPLRAVQELLGHANIQQTQRYAHLVPGAGAGFVALLDDPLPQPAPQQSGHNMGTVAHVSVETLGISATRTLTRRRSTSPHRCAHRSGCPPGGC